MTMRKRRTDKTRSRRAKARAKSQKQFYRIELTIRRYPDGEEMRDVALPALNTLGQAERVADRLADHFMEIAREEET